MGRTLDERCPVTSERMKLAHGRTPLPMQTGRPSGLCHGRLAHQRVDDKKICPQTHVGLLCGAAVHRRVAAAAVALQVFPKGAMVNCGSTSVLSFFCLSRQTGTFSHFMISYVGKIASTLGSMPGILVLFNQEDGRLAGARTDWIARTMTKL